VLLTTIGRRTGKQHTTPVFHLQDGERIILCNVTSGGERANPWTLNLRAHPLARVQLGAQVRTYRARAATEAELERYWPQLLRVWPAYERFYRQGGRRRCSCSTPPPRSSPNRRNRARPEASLRDPTPPSGSSRPNREMGVALLQELADLGNSWLGGGSRSRGS